MSLVVSDAAAPRGPLNLQFFRDGAQNKSRRKHYRGVNMKLKKVGGWCDPLRPSRRKAD